MLDYYDNEQRSPSHGKIYTKSTTRNIQAAYLV